MVSTAEVFSIVSRSESGTFHSSSVFDAAGMSTRSPCSLVAMVTNALIVQLDGFTKTTPLSVSTGNFSRFLFVAMMKQSG